MNCFCAAEESSTNAFWTRGRASSSMRRAVGELAREPRDRSREALQVRRQLAVSSVETSTFEYSASTMTAATCCLDLRVRDQLLRGLLELLLVERLALDVRREDADNGQQDAEDEEGAGGDDAAARGGGAGSGSCGHGRFLLGVAGDCGRGRAYSVSAAATAGASSAVAERRHLRPPLLRQLLHDDLDRGDDRDGDDRADHAHQGAEDHHADDDEEARDVRRLAEDRRLQHVVLELLVDEDDGEHDQRRGQALRERREDEDGARDGGADHRDQVEQAGDDAHHDGERRPEDPGGDARTACRR